MDEVRAITAAPVVAYVIDTTGRIEIETASFLNSPRPEFVDAVCAFLPKLKFEPFVVADQKWRVLLVQMYGFNWRTPDTAMLKNATALQSKSQEQFATSPIEKVIPQLDSMPHCDPAQALLTAENFPPGSVDIITVKSLGLAKKPHHDLYVVNGARLPLRVTDVGIDQCDNVQPCSLKKVDIPVGPGQKRLLLRVEPKYPSDSWHYQFHYDWKPMLAPVTAEPDTASKAPCEATIHREATAGRVVFHNWEVNTPAQMNSNNRGPRYPQLEEMAGIGGTVLAEFVVDSAGRADMTTFGIIDPGPSSFLKTVLDYLPSGRFSPGRLEGRPVAVCIKQSLEFRVNR